MMDEASPDQLLTMIVDRIVAVSQAIVSTDDAIARSRRSLAEPGTPAGVDPAGAR
nr:hypothetical protein [uncultured organism]